MSPATARQGSTVKEFMDRHGVSRPTVYRWSRECGLKLTKIGPNCTRILHEDEERWLASRRSITQ